MSERWSGPDTTDGAAGETDCAPPSTSDADLRDRLTSALRSHEHVLLCLDFDGTLAPIVADPDAATIRPGNRERLHELSARDDVTVAVVSGRELADVRDRVGVGRVHYVGNAGLERTRPEEDGVRVHPDARRTERRLARVRDTLVDKLGWTAGIEIEDKRWSLAVHTRNVPEDRYDRIAETVGRVADRAGGLHVSRGREVLEVGPASDATKGAAVAALADEVADEHGRDAPTDPLVVYVGDDRSDQTGLEAAADRGVAVFVGEDGPDDAHHVASPAAVGDLLGWLASDDGVADDGTR
ncbi:trehalose-phosphatase [Halomarina oriensis]|uniref:Trehalose 6-phosphate phosphatase n=1 Tax=Halomarina oriensis TaxID=671145 RepID=A0A6B0GMP2_9EURY|nr:trehalose-phosphatase [Halomarina oriensis]MWG34917.1 trehalose-phosphatase [Halomarina oriensis]